jgi:hypothetical protein
MKDQPDVNQGAMRPAAPVDDEQERVPTIDNPPRSGADAPSFDRATAAEEDERKNETLQPGTPSRSEEVEKNRQSGAI